jgi:hypothetical protein
MKEIRLALIGFETCPGINTNLAQLRGWYEQKYGVRFYITAICDPIKGTAFDPDGLSWHIYSKPRTNPAAWTVCPVPTPAGTRLK